MSDIYNNGDNIDKDGNLINPNSLLYDPYNVSENRAREIVKDRIGIPYPYKKCQKNKEIIVEFSDHFKDQIRKALSIGYIVDMTDDEKSLYFGYLDFANDDLMVSDINKFNHKTYVYQALDDWLEGELFGTNTDLPCEEKIAQYDEEYNNG